MEKKFKEEKKTNLQLEKKTHSKICEYLNNNYPNVYFVSGATGIKGTFGVRNDINSKACKNKKTVDLHILKPNDKFHGFVLEVKIESPWLADGVTLKNDKHLKEQLETINHLIANGYYANFSNNYDHAIELIEKYFKNELI